MKYFEQLSKEISLYDAFDNDLGMMYQETDDSDDNIVVRRFYNTELLPIYLDLYNYIVQWIKDYLGDYVVVPELVGFGKDYIIRHWFVYYVSLYRYFDEDEPIVPPIEFSIMKDILESFDLSSVENNVLKDVLFKTLLGSTGKTYFDSELGKFVVVEPKISVKNLVDWNACIKKYFKNCK